MKRHFFLKNVFLQKTLSYLAKSALSSTFLPKKKFAPQHQPIFLMKIMKPQSKITLYSFVY